MENHFFLQLAASSLEVYKTFIRFSQSDTVAKSFSINITTFRLSLLVLWELCYLLSFCSLLSIHFTSNRSISRLFFVFLSYINIPGYTAVGSFSLRGKILKNFYLVCLYQISICIASTGGFPAVLSAWLWFGVIDSVKSLLWKTLGSCKWENPIQMLSIMFDNKECDLIIINFVWFGVLVGEDPILPTK